MSWKFSVPISESVVPGGEGKSRRFRFAFMRRRDFPLLILVAGIVLTVGMWDFSNRQRSERILDSTKHQGDEIRLLLTNHIATQFSFLPRFGSMINEKEQPLSEQTQKYLVNTFKNFSSILAVQLVDGQRNLPIWTQAQQGGDFPAGLSNAVERIFTGQILISKEWKSVVATATNTNSIAISSPFAFLTTTEGKDPVSLIYAVYPVRDAEGVVNSYLIEYLNVENLLNDFFKGQNLLFYHYLISYRWEILYSDLKYWRDVTTERPFKVTREIPIADKKWWLNIWPKEESLVGEIQFELTGILLLAMGILFSLSAALFAWSLVTRSDTLEKLVHERTKQLEEVNQAIKNKNEELESFIYVLSHDLKAPLVSINGFLSLLQGTTRAKLSEEEKQCLDRISANTTHMHEMVQNLLELARVGRAEEIMDNVDTREVAREVLAELKPILDKKGIQANIVGDFPVIHAPRTRLLQIFSNLIGNAVKYIGNAYPPKIEIAAQAVGDGVCQFYVKDNGIGVPKEYHDRIFMVFQRGYGSEKFGEGTGIGLSIVKKIVESRGGKVWLESEQGKGSTFYFTLPRSLN